MDPNNIQQRMQEIQKDQSFASALGKILSGKQGYNPVIEMRKEPIRCSSCGTILDENMKFCSECGTKVKKPSTEEKK